MADYRTLETTPETGALETPKTAAEYAAQAKADNTQRAYQSDLKTFSVWCIKRRTSSLPAAPQVVAEYISALANQGRKTSTIRRALSAIGYAHRTQKMENPTAHPAVREVVAGIARANGSRKEGKTAITTETLRSLLDRVSSDLGGIRDRALLLMGFSGALRRSELVGLEVEDLDFVDRGVRILIRRSKGDQQGEGETLGIPFGQARSTCPVTALEKWLELSGTSSGPIFRQVTAHGHVGVRALTGRSVARIVKGYCEEAGLAPQEFGAHSLRSGFITSAALAGASERQISRQSRHKSVAVLRSYVQAATVFDDSAAAMVGL